VCFCYDANGNIRTLQRYRHLPEPIDNLIYTYNGNRLATVTDSGTPDGYPQGITNYTYDANGNNTFEGTRTRVTYNEINLPQQVQLLGGRGIKNIYAADGRKLKTETRQGTEYIKEGTKTYSGNLVFDINDELDYILFDEGRILYNIDDSTFKFEYHLKDHLGSTRVAFVPTVSGTEVVQENNYYPFGAPIGDLSWSPKSTNRYLREGKEYISDFDWNKYDFTGRTFDSWALRALQVDPMATKYYSTSPYALWINNPLRVIDPTGMWAEEPENSSWWDKLKQLFSMFGIGGNIHQEEQGDSKQSEERHENYTKLQGLSKTMQENKETAQEVLDYVPFVGAAFSMSEGMIENDNTTFAAGLGMLAVDAAGGELLKGAGKAAINSGAKGGRNAFRYMTEGELKAIQKTELLRGGRAGATFWTKDLYKSAANAQNRLALPNTPTFRVEFEILNSPILLKNGTKVLPANGMIGGGAEFMTLDPVKVRLINWQKLK
jgi:RHS repeat-associated protein